MLLVCRIIWRSVESKSLTNPFRFSSLASSQFFCPSFLSYLSARRLLVFENAPYPVMAQINSVLVRCKLRYFLFVEVTGFRKPRTDFLTGIVLRVPTMGESFLTFRRKDEAKISQIILYTPANLSPVLFVMRCINILSDWIVRTTAA